MKKFFISLLILIMGTLSYSSEKIGLEVGNILKPFKIYTYPQGKMMDNNDFKGKVTILNFATTWCPACLEEKKEQEKFIKENPELMKEINLVPILMDSQKDIEKYLNKHAFSFNVYEDRGSMTGNSFLIRAVPMTFILDKNGKIIYKQTGILNYKALKKALEKKELE